MNNKINNFKNIPNEEKPRERLIRMGPKMISSIELISILLKTGTKEKSVDEVSTELFSLVKNINELKDITLKKLLSIKGIGETKATSLLASIELGRRIYEYKDLKKYNIKNPIDVVNYYYKHFECIKQEEFHVLYLDNKNNILDDKTLFVGTVNKSIVHPREIFKNAYLLSASKIVCFHNHPSGNPNPSIADINITNNINELSIIHDINLVDHIIIGDGTYYSFIENNKIKRV